MRQRQDKQSSELCIHTEEYSNDIKDDNWKLLKEIIVSIEEKKYGYSRK